MRSGTLLRLIVDENFHGDIVRGLRRRLPELDLIRIQDVGLAGIDDPTLLDWANQHDRILLTHDRATMPFHAMQRFRSGLKVAGIFVVDDRAAIGRLIDELALAIECSDQIEWQDQVVYFPLS